MHLHFEKLTSPKGDCSIQSISWMGKVPEDADEEDPSLDVHKEHYWSEGWLASGNIRGMVGITFTSSTPQKDVEIPLRSNFNLRGHRADVIMVKWNEPYQKLASCDSTGVIFVWIKYEGRWSVELINDRNHLVTHFAWSHDGRMALICYDDGFVLVGSVAGQRYWSSMLPIEATVTCGIWTPDDQQVYFGTSTGELIVMDVHGAMVTQTQLVHDVGITAMAWSCEKFKLDVKDDFFMRDHYAITASKRPFILAVSFQNGSIYLLKSHDDISPCHINTGFNGDLPIRMEWSGSRELLAVSGTIRFETKGNTISYYNELQFYTQTGCLLYRTRIPHNSAPISCLTWGHRDRRLFVATGNMVVVAWVSRRIASLQLLCRLQVQASVKSYKFLPLLPLPDRLKSQIRNLFAQTLRCSVPDFTSLTEFLSRPPPPNTRLQCTIIRHDDDCSQTSGTCYTLYVEFLGGLVPLLKGKRTSKIRPEFVIYDPQGEIHGYRAATARHTDSSESDIEDKCRSPRLHRKLKTRNKKRSHSERSPNPAETVDHAGDLLYVDTLPEHVKLVEVTSNIWGTKFKIHGLAKNLPANLGQITYKTSLLHLQPRQMTLVITELRDDYPTGPDPNFNPNIFSEDEEDSPVHRPKGAISRFTDDAPPIAPMSPRPNRFTSRPRNHHVPSPLATPRPPPLLPLGPLARAESYEDDDNNEPAPERAATSYSRIMNQYSRSSSTSSNQSRVAISPLYCEGSVPTLQSPKNAVAPSDIIFDRPPAACLPGGGQTTLMSYSSGSNDYPNVAQVKNALAYEHRSNNQHVNPLPLNLNLTLERMEVVKKPPIKKKEVQHKPVTTPGIPEIITRSCSVGYLDDMDMAPGEVSLMMLRRDMPSKRLVLVNKKRHKRKRTHGDNKKKIRQTPKSKSMDFCDIIQDTPNIRQDLLNLFQLPKVNEDSEEVIEKPRVRVSFFNGYSRTPILNRKEHPRACVICKQISPMLHSRETVCTTCKKTEYEHRPTTTTTRNHVLKKSLPEQRASFDAPGCSSSTSRHPRMEIVTSFTDSPLMTRKYRQEDKDARREMRRRRREDIEKTVPDPDPMEQRTYVSFQTQALTTLENIISRLRDLDDGRLTPPSSPQFRQPRSTPASPAPSKKQPQQSNSNKSRHQSSSPIRQILNSPLLNRRARNKNKNPNPESSDDEYQCLIPATDETTTSSSSNGGGGGSSSKHYRDLETFQKAQLRQKLKRGKIEPNGISNCSQAAPFRREFVMHNKAPMWNENSQVYQLDFGGRVTQESAKNFQIEFRGKQVMQFGRIDGNAYTLDFQYPFSGLQAFAVALANVTQRLK